ncbi:calcium/sodium antiporter [Patescibacteria group bacterium]|nr:calcium/sodium antiporter [Patescibacteria group bacterium]
MTFFIILFLVIGILSLYKGADLLVKHSSSLAAKLGISTMAVGLTVITFGTILPEFTVAIISSINKANDLIIGNALGTTAFCFGFILGLAALINPIAIKDSTLKNQFPWIGLYAVVIYLLAFDLTISRGDGGILLLLGAAFVGYSIYQSRKERIEEIGKRAVKRSQKKALKTAFSWIKIILGILLIIGGAKLLIDSSLAIVSHLGASELIIGIVVIAIGTSLPEFVTMITASFKDRPAVGIGNVIGGATMNVFAIVGIASVIDPIKIHPDMLVFDFPAVIFFVILISVLFASSHKLTRFEGALLIAGYIGYLVYSIKFWG